MDQLDGTRLVKHGLEKRRLVNRVLVKHGLVERGFVKQVFKTWLDIKSCTATFVLY